MLVYQLRVYNFKIALCVTNFNFIREITDSDSSYSTIVNANYRRQLGMSTVVGVHYRIKISGP